MRNKIFSFLTFTVLALLITFASCGGESDPVIYEPPVTESPEEPEYPNESTSANPYINDTEGYKCFRIPTMVITKTGVVLAFAEGRRNDCEDTGDIDIVLKRSTDGGQTWSPIIAVRDDGVNRCRNPVPIVLPESGRILLVSCWNLGSTGTNNVFVSYSDDEGLTWSPHVNITTSVKPSNYVWYATGPCHGIVKRENPHKGRIIVPCNHNESGTQKELSHAIYSDDDGVTWKLGGSVDWSITNESTVVELSNGDLMLNMRETTASSSADRYRIISTSTDGGVTWGPCRYDRSLPEPISQGSIFYYGTGENGKGQLLFSNPNHQTSRRNLTLRLSEDDGATWTKKYQYIGTDEYGSYSDIAKFSDGKIALLYEYGYMYSGGIWFRTVDFSELK